MSQPTEINITGHGVVCFKLTQTWPDDDGQMTLEAWWKTTDCAVVPRVCMERWSDKGWRVAGDRTRHPTAEACAVDIINRVARGDADIPSWARRYTGA